MPSCQRCPSTEQEHRYMQMNDRPYKLMLAGLVLPSHLQLKKRVSREKSSESCRPCFQLRTSGIWAEGIVPYFSQCQGDKGAQLYPEGAVECSWASIAKTTRKINTGMLQEILHCSFRAKVSTLESGAQITSFKYPRHTQNNKQSLLIRGDAQFKKNKKK